MQRSCAHLGDSRGLGGQRGMGGCGAGGNDRWTARPAQGLVHVEALGWTANKMGSCGVIFRRRVMPSHRGLQRAALVAVWRAGSKGQGHEQGDQLGGEHITQTLEALLSWTFPSPALSGLHASPRCAPRGQLLGVAFSQNCS